MRNLSFSSRRSVMDEQPDNPQMNSMENLTNGAELNKKRKLQYDLENLDLPLCKHKFGDRFRSTGLTIAEETCNMQNFNKEMVARGLTDESEELGESCNDSNSVSESYDTTMTLDLDDEEAEKSSGKTGSPSVSSNNLKNSIYGSNLDSFDIQNVRESSNKEQEDLDDVQLLELGYKGTEEQHPELEGYGNYIIQELGKNSLEHLDAEIEDLMLYSNDVAPHAFLLSSDRWISGQDAQSTGRKPTIDKEFEQYFSMLML